MVQETHSLHVLQEEEAHSSHQATPCSQPDQEVHSQTKEVRSPEEPAQEEPSQEEPTQEVPQELRSPQDTCTCRCIKCINFNNKMVREPNVSPHKQIIKDDDVKECISIE